MFVNDNKKQAIMKRTMHAKLFLAAVATFLLSGCVATPPLGHGDGGDMAKLIFVSSDKNAKGNVKVKVNGKNEFDAKVAKAKPEKESKSKKTKQKGRTYSVPSGRQTITVTRDGKTVYEGEITVSPKETKTIVLP